MPSHDDEYVELLSKPEKDLEYSIFEHPSAEAIKRQMDEQQGRRGSRWTIPLAAGLLFMVIVTIGLTVTLINRESANDGLKDEIYVVSPSPTPYKAPAAVAPDEEQGPLLERSRLPTNVRPSRYDIVLQPNITTGLFEGSCIIWVLVTAPTRFFVLHSEGLNFTDWAVYKGNESRQQLNVLNMISNPANEYVMLTMDRPVEAEGIYQLSFNFNGVMGDDKLHGLYRSKYDTKDGGQRYLVLTDFEPTDARRVFPCFDEPQMKAIFEMTVVHESQYRALSNMPERDVSINKDGYTVTTFHPTVSMSTYLVCVVVSDFIYTSNKTNTGTEVRVFSSPDQVNDTRYALEVAVKALQFYTDYFNITYPLPKLDLVAIPDFMSGAMENWGLITFRDTMLLYDPAISSDSNKLNVMLTVVHELGHQWFGNLVTMQWWNDLWLNEGFARYLEQLCGDEVEKSWGQSEIFVVDNNQMVMVEDAGSHSHPIVQTVNNPQDINSIFDHVSYSKGGAIIYMLDAVLGRQNFRRGLHNYLSRFSYKNAMTSDLWDELSGTSNPKLNVSVMMDTWTRQVGFPVVEIRRSHQNPKELNVTQKRFFSMPNDSLTVDTNNSSSSPYGYMWEVPLTYVDPVNGSLAVHWLHQESQNTLDMTMNKDKPVKFNVNNTGYYRVNYENDVWLLFSEQLMNNHSTFSRLDRANLLDDVFSLSRGGYLNYSVALTLVRYLKNETDYVPMTVAILHLLSLGFKLEPTDIYPLIRNFSLSLLNPMYERLGWEEYEDWNTRRLQQSIVGAACKFGNQHCLQQSIKLFQEWKAGSENISQNLRGIVYKYGIQSSYSMEDWELVWTKYNDDSNSAQEKERLLMALAATREPSLIYRFIEYVKDPAKVRSQDFFRMLSVLAVNRVAAGAVWDYVRSDWENIVKRFTLNNRSLANIISAVAPALFEEISVKEMEAFIAEYPNIGAGQLKRQQALDAMRRGIEWLGRCKGDIKQWLILNAALTNE